MLIIYLSESNLFIFYCFIDFKEERETLLIIAQLIQNGCLNFVDIISEKYDKVVLIPIKAEVYKL